MLNEQIQRISQMERAMNEAAEAMNALFAALERYEAALPGIAALEEYYQSPLWLQDFDDDRAGKLPQTLRRGVLSEDALYDLLCSHSRLQEEMRRAGRDGE